MALNKFEFQKYQVVLYTRLKTLVFFARSVVDNFAQSWIFIYWYSKDKPILGHYQFFKEL